MDIEKLLAEGEVIKIKPQGWSMYPLITYGRDYAIVQPADSKSLKAGDVVLYRRDESILVLHRIWKRKGDEFYMVGDNQTEIEGPLRADQIKGRMIKVIRKGKEISVNNVGYRIYSRLWMWLRPCRPAIGKVVHRLKGKK